MKMTYDAEASAAYIQLASRVTPVDDSRSLEILIAGINEVVLDLDSNHELVGVELLGRVDAGPEAILAAIANESIANAVAAEGFECPELRGNPSIDVKHIG